jgi:hypothetical protein
MGKIKKPFYFLCYIDIEIFTCIPAIDNCERIKVGFFELESGSTFVEIKNSGQCVDL